MRWSNLRLLSSSALCARTATCTSRRCRVRTTPMALSSRVRPPRVDTTQRRLSTSYVSWRCTRLCVGCRGSSGVPRRCCSITMRDGTSATLPGNVKPRDKCQHFKVQGCPSKGKRLKQRCGSSKSMHLLSFKRSRSIAKQPFDSAASARRGSESCLYFAIDP